MKLESEDPRLTAYVLGELDPGEVAAVKIAIEADPLLLEEVGQIEGMRTFLSQRLPHPGGSLLPAQREIIRRSALGLPSLPAGHSPGALKDALHPWLIPAAAAAVLTVATFIMFWKPGDSDLSKFAGSPSDDSSARPAGIGSPLETQAGDLAGNSKRIVIAQTDPLTLDLPVIPDRAGLESITRSIQDDGAFPPKESVRLGEILNNFQLRLSGMASISRSAANNWHPDDRSKGISNHVATLSSELISCPWKPSARLLLISLRANPRTDSDVRITFHSNPETVTRYRLLGFRPDDGSVTASPPTRLPAGSFVNLALEIEPSGASGNLGSLDWSTDGEAAPSISLVLNPGAEPSDDARFAALVCTYSEWLAGEQSGMIDADIVAALAREIASSNLPPDRMEFLNLIDRSIHLESK